MANFRSYSALDFDKIDLNFYSSEFYEDDYINSANIDFLGTIYNDYYWINGYDGENDLQIEFLGEDFIRAIDGRFVGGTVNVIAEFDISSEIEILSILYNVSISASAIYSAALTPANSDELTLIIAALGGDDEIILSDFADHMGGFSGNDSLRGNAGNDEIDGGSGVDTAEFAGNRSSYTITQGSTGVFTISGPDGTDTLRTVEYAQFDDQTLRLLPGTGTTVNFQTDNPTAYMAAIRDFDGNNLGSASGWTRIGQADVNGDGDTDQIFTNRDISRFAEVATAPDGKVYFSDHGWAGETRVVGIYIDPLVQSGEVVAGGPNDSQRRFQNDLAIGNINRVLGADDYDNNGLQEVYFSLTDGTAYLHAYMHADGNIQYANYQSQQQVTDYLAVNGWAAGTYAGWFG